MQTFDWDTVFVIAASRVNAAFAANMGSLLVAFESSLPSDPPVSASGQFDSWEIVQGGAGKLLYLKLPINAGTMSIGPGTVPPMLKDILRVGTLETPRLISLVGVSVVVSLQLQLLPRTSEPVTDLRFDMRQPGQSPGEGFVTPVTVLDPSGQLTVADKSLLGALIVTMLVANAAQVSYVFASINLVPPQADSWLAPIASDYAYFERGPSGPGYLAVLSITQPRDISQLPRTVDPDAITTGATGSFLISKLLFLEKVIQPCLATAYGTTPDVFYVDRTAHAIRNSCQFETFSVTSGAITYHPRINSLSITTSREGLSTIIEGECDLKAGIWMTFRIQSENPADFDVAGKTISFRADPNPQNSHDADIPWYFWFLGPISELITELVVKLIADGVAGSLNSLAAEALSIARNPPQSIVWTDAQHLGVSAAGVNDSFFMIGQI